MTDRTDPRSQFDTVLVDWLDSTARREPEDLLERVLAETVETRRRPSWWRPVGTPRALRGLAMAGRTVALAAVVGLLVLALLLSLAIGSRRPSPLGGAGMLVAARQGELVLVDRTGAVQARVPTGGLKGYASWSPDGTRVAHGDGLPDAPVLVIADEHLAEVMRIPLPASALPYFSWSPDGRRITFGTESQTVAQVWVVDVAEGARAVPITHVEDEATSPIWSPDGSLIAVRGLLPRGQSVLEVTRPEGTGLTRLSFTAGDVVQQSWFWWTPDGRSIVFETGDHRIWIVDADGTNQRALTPPGVKASCPSLSPDGSRVASSSQSTEAPFGPVVRFDPVQPDARLDHVQEDMPGPVSTTWPAVWSPDGNTVAVSIEGTAGGPNIRLFVDANGVEPPRPMSIDDAVVMSWQRLQP